MLRFASREKINDDKWVLFAEQLSSPLGMVVVDSNEKQWIPRLKAEEPKAFNAYLKRKREENEV